MAITLVKTSAFSSYKFVLVPVLSLFAVIVLGFVTYNIASKRITEQRNEITIQENEVAVLTSKVAVLNEESDILSTYHGSALGVLPEKNPILFVLYNLKQRALATTTRIEEIKVGSVTEIESGTSVSLVFTAAGDLNALLSLIEDLRSGTPLTTITKTSFEIADGAASVEVTSSTHFSKLPDTLPAITAPITKLSKAELDAFSSFELTSNQEFSLTPQRGDSTRDPFSF